MYVLEEYDYKYYVVCEVYHQQIYDWCNTNIGVKDNDWKPEWGGYAFKNKEDAIAFELTWK